MSAEAAASEAEFIESAIHGAVRGAGIRALEAAFCATAFCAHCGATITYMNAPVGGRRARCGKRRSDYVVMWRHEDGWAACSRTAVPVILAAPAAAGGG